MGMISEHNFSSSLSQVLTNQTILKCVCVCVCVCVCECVCECAPYVFSYYAYFSYNLFFLINNRDLTFF